MNLRMYPRQSTSSRRLRRVPLSSATFANREQPMPLPKQSVHSQALAITQASSAKWAHPLIGSPLTHLSQTEQETLLRQQALSDAQRGHYAEAIDLFTWLINYNPENVSSFNNRGLLYFQTGQFSQALTDYNQALRLNPRLAKVYNNRANCYVAMGDLEAAIADYEISIDLDPIDIRARLNLGITFRDLEQYEAAIETFDLALQISQFLNTTDFLGVPTSVEGHLYAERGRTYHLWGDWNYAISDYDHALSRLPLTGYKADASYKLRFQINDWLNELLKPLR
ncbi:tetratricopeptide repeat protein [Phormidium sp. CLA17]|nr:tetratricopeptide repeat protein [Leptolyngbya sp. Cla-17]